MSTPGCRSCGERRAWWATVDPTGRRILVDPDPSDDGNLVLVPAAERVAVIGSPRPVVRVLPAAAVRARAAGTAEPTLDLDLDDARTDDVPRYRAHFATCPNADRHRGRR